MSVAESFHDFCTKPENLDFTNATVGKDKLVGILKNLTESLKNAPNRESLPTFVFGDMLSILARISHALHSRLSEGPKQVDKTIHMVDLATECFRALRNACAGCKRNQEETLRNPGLYWTAATILSSLVGVSKSSPITKSQEGKAIMVQCLRCGVQFLGNAAAGFDESKSLVWSSVFNITKLLLKADDGTLANYTCMLIYTCMTTPNMSDLISSKEGVDIISAVMCHFSKHETEWGLYIMEKLLAQSTFIETSYDKLSNKDRAMLLNFVCTKLRTLEDKMDAHNNTKRDPSLEIKVAIGNITFISSQFKTKSPAIINLTKVNDLENSEPVLVAKLLEVLCSATASHHYKDLQNDKELLKTGISLLQTVTMIGKQGENVFSSVGKASEADKANPEHPAFGLKRDLIRLLGNLSYRHPVNQNIVREQGGIPLILDHTNIDARNPYITQWSVFAMRNLCENNAENKAVVASLKNEGVADATILKELGYEASVEGNKVNVKPSPGSKKDTGAKTKR